MDADAHDYLSGHLRGLLVLLHLTLSREEAAEVADLLDHDEFGEALRTLAWLLVEEGKKVSTEELLEIRSLAATMEISEELPESLDECTE